MENTPVEKKSKSAKQSHYSSLRLKKDLKKRILSDLAKINKKDFGRKVKLGEYLDLLMNLLTPDHVTRLQEGSLSNADRLERDYRNYVTEHGLISKDDYLGKRLGGELRLQGGAQKNL